MSRPALIAALLLLVPAGLQPQERSAPDGARVIGYLAAGGVRSKGTRIAELAAERLTHIFYAFGRVGPDGVATLANRCLDVGECPDSLRLPELENGGNFARLRELKQRHPHLRVLISLGGWGGSRHISDAAADSAARARLVRSTLDNFLRAHPDVFDGVDVDWEFPVRGGPEGTRNRPEDRRNYTLLMQEYRRQLDALGQERGRRYELSIAVAAGAGHMANLEVAQLARVLDFVNLMTYDFHVGDTIAHFNSPLFPVGRDPAPAYNIETAVRLYVTAGVPRAQLVVGAPFYGRGYGNVGPDGGGFLQRAERTSPPGFAALDYRTILARGLERSGFRRYWQTEAQVPWLYSAERRIWISYDDPQSIGAKARWVREQGLGGIMFWELGGDDGSLLRAAASVLRPRH